MKVSVIVRCARSYGLLEPLWALALQAFEDDWEIIVVDWLYQERKELLAAWWHNATGLARPLVHVPPLSPLSSRGGKYHAWDLCLSFNTGLAHARGEVVMHLEDHWVVRPDWVRTFYDLVTEQPQFVVFGDKMAEPLYDDAAPGHYNLPRNPVGRFLPMEITGYGGAIFVNFAHKLEPFVQCSFPEWPSRWPETFWPDQLGRMGMGYAATSHAPAWHKYHPPGGGIVGYTSRMENGYLVYAPKHGADTGAASAYAPELQMPPDLHFYRRDLVAERQRLGIP